MEEKLENEDDKKKLTLDKLKKPIIIAICLLVVFIIFMVWRKSYISNLAEFELINGTTQEEIRENGKPVETYFKFVSNSIYEYKQLDGAAQNKSTFVTYYDATRVQYSVITPALADYWYNEVYEIEDGEIRKILSLPNNEQNVNLLEYEFEQEPTILLKEPVVVGNTWKTGNGEVESTITGVGVEIKTPNGLYKTVEVSTDYKNGNYRKDYYSETSGLVKTVEINSDGSKSDLVLSNIEPMSSGLDRAMYVYSLQKSTFNGTQTLVEFKTTTNKPMTEVFREILSVSLDQDLKPLISLYTKINKIELEPNLKYVHVDFSEEFYSYTSSDKNIESKHLLALANTFCRYYQVLNLKITVDGKPYTTTNYQFGEDDTIKAVFK